MHMYILYRSTQGSFILNSVCVLASGHVYVTDVPILYGYTNEVNHKCSVSMHTCAYIASSIFKALNNI